LSALAALMAFRKPEVTVGGASGTEVIVHPPEVKEPLPLTIHHLPVAVTFGAFDVSHAVKSALTFVDVFVFLYNMFNVSGFLDIA